MLDNLEETLVEQLHSFVNIPIRLHLHNSLFCFQVWIFGMQHQVLVASNRAFFMQAISAASLATCRSSSVARPFAITHLTSARASLSTYSVLATRDCFRLLEASESSCSNQEIFSAWWLRSLEPRQVRASTRYIISMLLCSRSSEGTVRMYGFKLERG